MPTKRLTAKQYDTVYEMVRYEDLTEVVDVLNHYFADIYGYTNKSRSSYGSKRRVTPDRDYQMSYLPIKKPKRKLSAWNKYVKANSNKPRFRYKSGAKKGKLNLRAMGVAFRKTPAGKKKRR